MSDTEIEVIAEFFTERELYILAEMGALKEENMIRAIKLKQKAA